MCVGRHRDSSMSIISLKMVGQLRVPPKCTETMPLTSVVVPSIRFNFVYFSYSTMHASLCGSQHMWHTDNCLTSVAQGVGGAEEEGLNRGMGMLYELRRYARPSQAQAQSQPQPQPRPAMQVAHIFGSSWQSSRKEPQLVLGSRSIFNL